MSDGRTCERVIEMGEEKRMEEMKKEKWWNFECK